MLFALSNRQPVPATLLKIGPVDHPQHTQSFVRPDCVRVCVCVCFRGVSFFLSFLFPGAPFSLSLFPAYTFDSFGTRTRCRSTFDLFPRRFTLCLRDAHLCISACLHVAVDRDVACNEALCSCLFMACTCGVLFILVLYDSPLDSLSPGKLLVLRSPHFSFPFFFFCRPLFA